MNTTFYFAAAIAILSSVKTVTELNAVHALLYLIVSFLSVAVIFYILGAPFAAALEVITYAGAIMVLFVFAIMMLNLGPLSLKQEKQWLNPKMWIGPSTLAVILLGEFIYALFRTLPKHTGQSLSVIGPEKVGAALLGQYALGVELASMLLLTGLVGAYHLGYRAMGLKETEKEKKPAQPTTLIPKVKWVPPPSLEKKAGAP